MLTKFSSFASSFASKILVGLLVLAFGVWGIEDMLRHPDSTVIVATVGDIKIPYSTYQKTLNNETDRMREMLGGRATPEDLKNLALGPEVLKHMIDEQLLVLEAKSIGLKVSDEDVANNIRKNPALFDDKGQFSKKNFEFLLRQNGMTEKMYIEKTRENMAVNLLLSSVVSLASVPENAAKTLLASREEKRAVDVYAIPASLITSIPAPTKEQLAEYYNSHIDEFTAPEYRTLSYVMITPENAKAAMKSAGATEADKDIETAYHERIDEFKKPERRKVEQLLFSTEDAARKALEAIKSGKSFEQIGKEANVLNQKAISLGLVEKSNIIEAAADKVFSLAVGAVSEPIKSSFGWHLFRVTEIIPPTTQPLEEVRDQLEKDLDSEANDNAMSDFSNKIEDSIAGGSTLAEVAKEFNLKVVTLPPLDKNGKTEDGSAIKDLPKDAKFLDTAFKTDEKTESALISANDGNKFIVRVEKIAPQHVLTQDEVKTQLLDSWTKREKKKQLEQLAAKISAEFTAAKSPADIENIAKKYSLSAPMSLTVSQKNDAGEQPPSIPLPERMLKDIFSRQIGKASAAYPQAGGGYSIAVVKNIIAADANDKDPKYSAKLASIETELKNDMKGEIVEQYIDYLAKKYRVSINSAALQIKGEE